MSKDGSSFFLPTLLSEAAKWAQKNSLLPMPFGTSCCGIEMMSTLSSTYDLSRFGAEVLAEGRLQQVGRGHTFQNDVRRPARGNRVRHLSKELSIVLVILLCLTHHVHKCNVLVSELHCSWLYPCSPVSSCCSSLRTQARLLSLRAQSYCKG